MLSYIPRYGGEPLGPTTWRQLYLDPSYATIKQVTQGPITVEASWVGVVSDAEDPPKPYLVTVRRCASRRRRQAEPLLSDRWCATEEEALEVFDRIQKEVFGG